MKSVTKIQNQKMYVGSGTDDIVDENLKTELDIFGQYGVDYTKAESDKLLNTMLNSDDSRNDDDIASSLFAKTKDIKHNSILGYYLDLYVGYAKKGGHRRAGSSGGLVTWLATKLLEAGEVDGLIHVKKSKKPGLIFEYGISRTADEFKSGAKSRYYPVELSSVLKEVKRKKGTYAVVGIPEVITELRLLAENDKAINRHIKYYLGLIAGHQKTTKYAEAIAWEYGIKPGDLEDIDFRHKRNEGKASEYDMKFTGKVDGKRQTFIVRNNESFITSWAHGMFKANFSDYTDNSFNESADVTFGDAWLKEYVDDPRGNNVLIVRNEKIAKIFKSGIENGEVNLDSVDKKVIIRSQRGLVRHTKDELPYRLDKERQENGWAPLKRKPASDNLPKDRKKVQDARQKIAKMSHVHYKEAVRRDDFEYYRAKMQPLLDKYAVLYGQPPKKSKKVKADGAILTLTGYFNYGNVVQRYALQKFLSLNGYNFVSYLNVHVPGKTGAFPYRKKLKYLTPVRYVKRFMSYRKPYWYVPTIAEIYPQMKRNANLIEFVNKNIKTKVFEPNDNYKNYIVGSDQIWRNWRDRRDILGYYFLNFLRGKGANRVSYAASFGKDNISEVMSMGDIEYVRPSVEKFNHISVREKSGVKILKDEWGVDAVSVVDPTLLLDKEYYSQLVESSDSRFEKTQPIFTYIIGETPDILNFVRKVQDSRKQAVTSIRAHAGSEKDILPPVESWLKGFRDSEIVITNSFHGMMLSVVNSRDFLIIGREIGGLSRISDFLTDFGLEDRFVDETNIGQFRVDNLKPIDWEKVQEKIKVSQESSGDWLLSALK